MAKFPEEKELEFHELVSYVGFFATRVWGVPETAREHPSHFVTPVRGQISKSQLLFGLRQAARDTLEETEHYSEQKIAALDSEFAANNFLTISQVRERYGRK